MRYFEEEMQEDIKNFLRLGETFITFRKTDGTVRNMRCTLFPALISSDWKESVDRISIRTRKRVEDVICVYDLDENDWRSFRQGSLTEIWRIISLGGGNFSRLDLGLI